MERVAGIASQNNELGLIDTRNKTLEKQQQQQQPKAATLQPSRLGKWGNKELEKKRSRASSRLVLSRLERRNQEFSRVCDDDEWCGHPIT